jgi:phospholipase/lecithinase/hemolysin
MLHVQWISGFVVINAPCCPSFDIGGLCIPDEKPCSNRDEYVFWDQFHTTEAWNQYIAIGSYNSFKHLVEQETKMELEPINEVTSQLSASS